MIVIEKLQEQSDGFNEVIEVLQEKDKVIAFQDGEYMARVTSGIPDADPAFDDILFHVKKRNP